MAEKTREIGIRLSVKDADVAKAALTAFGTEGAAALKRLEVASAPASTSLLSLSNAIDKTREVGASRLEALADQFKEVGSSILLPLASLATLTGAFEAFKAQIERADSANKLSASLGLSVEALTQLEHAADLADISTDQLSTGLRQLSNNAALSVESSTGNAAKAFQTLGVNVKTASGSLKSTDQLFADVADKFANLGNSSTKTSLAMQIFGRSGAALIPLLNEGRDGLKQLADQSDQLGLTISSQAAASAEEFNDKLTVLGERITGVISRVTQEALPAFNALVDQFDSLISDGPLMSTVFTLLEGGVRDLTSFMVQLVGATKELSELLGGLSLAAEGLQRGEGFGSFFATMTGALQDFNKTASDTEKLANAVLNGTPLPQSNNASWQALIAGFGKGGATAPPPALTSTTTDQAQKKIDAVSKSIDLQIKNLTETNRQQEINNELSRAGVTIDSDAGNAIAAKAAQYYDEKQAIEEANQAAGFLAQTGESAIESFVEGKEDAVSAINDITSALESAVLQAALLGSGPLGNIFGGAPTTSGATGGFVGSLLSSFGLGAKPNAKGGVYSSPSLSAFSNSIVSQPTMFRFASGAGLMGEAGPEAIMPLTRGADGRLGVAGGTAAPTSIEVTIRTVNGQAVQTKDAKASQSKNGGLSLDLLLDTQMSQTMSKPGSQTRRTMRVQFGLNPSLTKR